jgi:hypothetical protein
MCTWIVVGVIVHMKIFMCTWIVVGVIVLLVLFTGAWRTRGIPSRSRAEALVMTLGKRYLGEAWNEKFVPADGAQVQNADRLLAYADRILERQISKARGILPFNAIILAIISFERGRIPDTLALSPDLFSGPLGFAGPALARFGPCEIQLPDLVILTLIGLGLSSLMCLSLFWFRWGSNRVYESFPADVAFAFKAVRKRSRKIEWATVIAQACLIIAILLVAAAEFNVRSGRGAPAISASAGMLASAAVGPP